MNLLLRLWQSSLGKKYIMALTGAGLFFFVIGHLAGNLQVFGPPELINTYAHFLKSKPGLLWGARLGLLGCVGLHIAAAISLTALNNAARPVAYAGGSAYGSSARSRYMVVSGLVIFTFVVYHLLHFTALLPGVNGVGDFRKLTTPLNGEVVPDVYAMMIVGFQVWWVTLFYLIAQALLFMHLSHGVSSMFQSLGLRNHTWWPRITLLAKVVSIAIFLGYASIPIAVAAGLGKSHAQTARQSLALNLQPSPEAK
jgi:succinate dehydrogenase / fumarate reductase, cytochrome b subunit